MQMPNNMDMRGGPPPPIGALQRMSHQHRMGGPMGPMPVPDYNPVCIVFLNSPPLANFAVRF